MKINFKYSEEVYEVSNNTTKQIVSPEHSLVLGNDKHITHDVFKKPERVLTPRFF